MATANFTTKPPMLWMNLGVAVRFLKSALQRYVSYDRVASYGVFARASQTKALFCIVSAFRFSWLRRGEVMC
jgi:hypothetical protein